MTTETIPKQRIALKKLQAMSPTVIDNLPMPISLRGKQYRWTGYEFERLGDADGAEPVEVITDDE